MPFHFRYTPHDLKYNLKDFTNQYGVHIAAREYAQRDNKALHYHIYIDTDDCRDTVINHARKVLNIPKGERGKANRYFMCKNWDENIDYFCKGNKPPYVKGHDIVSYAGYTLEQIQTAHESGWNRYIKDTTMVEETPPASAGETPSAARPRIQKDEWTKLYEFACGMREEERTALQWRKVIVKYYLAQLRPIPRTGDLMRYSNSLNILFKSEHCMLQNKFDILCEQYVDSLELQK